jgi:hypothetical protein
VAAYIIRSLLVYVCGTVRKVNFNVNFKIAFKTIHSCVSWGIKNLIISRCTVCVCGNLNLLFNSIFNVGNKLIYCLQIPKKFDKFNKSHYVKFL